MSSSSSYTTFLAQSPPPQYYPPSPSVAAHDYIAPYSPPYPPAPSPLFLCQNWYPADENNDDDEPLPTSYLENVDSNVRRIYGGLRDAFLRQWDPYPTFHYGFEIMQPEEAVILAHENRETSERMHNVRNWQSFYEVGRALDKYLDDFYQDNMDGDTDMLEAAWELKVPAGEARTASRIFRLIGGNRDVLWQVQHIQVAEVAELSNLEFDVVERRMRWFRERYHL